MAFFDDISKKITDATSSAAQKTRELAEISRLNSAVNEEESKLNNAYVQIGKLYCANHSEDYEDCFATFVNAVKESEKKIADMQAQIRELKGIVPCPTCGEYIPRNAAFCSNCGTPTQKVTPVVESNVVMCPKCGNSVLKGMRFCTSCGFRMPEPVQQPIQTPIQQPVQEAVQEAAQPYFAEIQVNEETVIENAIPDVDLEDASKLVMSQQQQEFAEISSNVSVQETYSPANNPVQQPQGKVCPMCGKVLAEGMLFCTECGTRL